MDDDSDQPLADDLSFLGDLDHGLDLDRGFDPDHGFDLDGGLDLDRGLDLHRGLDRDAFHEETWEPVGPPTGRPGRPIASGSERTKSQTVRPVDLTARHQTRPSRRDRPLLELFPVGPVEHAAPPPTVSARPQLPSPAASRRPGTSQPRLRSVAPGGQPTYETFYGLNEKPFSLTSDPRFLYHSTAHDRVAHEMLAAIERRDGAVMVTGVAGSGKTTACRLVIGELDAHIFTSLVIDSFVTIEKLLKTVLIDFGVISHADLSGGRLSDASQYELTIVLKEFLLSLVRLDGFAVIVVDDAHNLSPETLEQVRNLSDLERDKQLLQLVLVGEPSLLTRRGRPEVHRVEPRLMVRCDLGPLTKDEIAGYVIHRLAVSGDGPSRVEFDSHAFTRIHEFSRGVPRMVNRICDRALTLGYEQSASMIDAALVEAAAQDLDLILPEASPVKAWRVAVGATALVGLMLIGAAAAAFVFNTRVQRVIAAWQAIPSPPLSPAPRMVRPVAPLPVPENGASSTPPGSRH